tara:strand:+ start:50 stop:1099 length:1050 start_codon:yes stop_codon:yes gene_type:complete
MEYINKLSHEEVLNSYNFARKADIVYSEIISLDKYKKLNNKDHVIVYQDDKKVFYKIKQFTLKENQIIFCNSNFIESLFLTLNMNKNNNFKNIKLVTHQTDMTVSKEVFRKRPKCISKWFAININYEHQDLISLPIGLSNEYSPKNILKDDYNELAEVTFEDKKDSLYVNFQINTNFISRHKLEKKFKKYAWVHHEYPQLQIKQYLNHLQSYKFIFAPQGNGIDTHRVWETIYAGSIPVVKEHTNFNLFKDLPIIFYKDNKELTLDYLQRKEKEIKIESFSSRKLSISYWLEIMNKDLIPSNSEKVIFIESEQHSKHYINKYLLNEKIKSKIKIFLSFFRRIYLKIFDR